MGFLDSLKQLFGSSDQTPQDAPAADAPMGGDDAEGHACPHCGSKAGCSCEAETPAEPASDAGMETAEAPAAPTEETPAQ